MDHSLWGNRDSHFLQNGATWRLNAYVGSLACVLTQMSQKCGAAPQHQQAGREKVCCYSLRLLYCTVPKTAALVNVISALCLCILFVVASALGTGVTLLGDISLEGLFATTVGWNKKRCSKTNIDIVLWLPAKMYQSVSGCHCVTIWTGRIEWFNEEWMRVCIVHLYLIYC